MENQTLSDKSAAHEPKGAGISLDYREPSVRADPYPLYAVLREEHPVFRVPNTRDFILSRYEDVKWALSQTELFSNRRHNLKELDPEIAAIAKSQRYENPRLIPDADGEVHAEYRALAQRGFTPRRVREYEEFITSEADRLLREFSSKGVSDIAESYAYPLVLCVMGNILGLPTERLNGFAKSVAEGTELFSGYLDRSRALELQANDVAYMNALADVVDAKRVNPGTDLISEFMATPSRGGHLLTYPEVMEMTRTTFSGGTDGPALMILNTLLALLQNPGIFAKVLADRTLLPKAIEESIRIDTPSHWVHRWVTRDTTIRGVDVAKDSRLLLMLASANRDPAQFPNPESFSLDRDNLGTHLSFGRGIHNCFGTFLARSIGRIALNALLDRLPNLRLDIGRDIVHSLDVPSRRLLHLYVRFDA